MKSSLSLEKKLELLEARFTMPLESNNAILQSESNSQHSFGFDAVSPPATVAAGTTHARQKTIDDNINNKEWEIVAAAHMEKMASQDRTILTSHKRKSVPQKHAKPSVKVNTAATTSAVAATVTTFSEPTTAANLLSTPKQSNTHSHKRAKVSTSPNHFPKATSAMAFTSSNHNSNSSHSHLSTSKSPKSSSFSSSVSKSYKSNNRKIHDFFAKTQQRSSPLPPPPTKHHSANAAGKPKPLQDTSNHTTTPFSSSPNHSSSLDKLQREYQQLLQKFHDQDQQLKAITNNRTILHSALQNSLKQRETEISNLKESLRERDQRNAQILESMVRDAAIREAREVRRNLAVDTARLGKIVTSKAGYRSYETWEDGHADVEIQQKRKLLKHKRQHLEKRYVNALSRVENEESSTTTLEMVEAIESAKMHLDTLDDDERSLNEEVTKLNAEKAAHMRSLKRASYEDASRFRSRPKLHDRYVLQNLLGKGGFSEVWRAYDLQELRSVAVKIHQLDPRWPDPKKENYTKHVAREYEIQRSVQHPRIVGLYDVFEIDKDSFATVLEYCNGTDLDTVLKTKGKLPERHARAILLQILSGMRYLSQSSDDRPGIIHYDLKPGNILFDEHGDAMITDFGLSKILEDSSENESMDLTSQGAGTYWYLPPECFVLTDNVRISNKVDVWSIGVIFYQMLFGKRPFGDGISQERLLADQTMLNATQVSFPETPVVTEGCRAFIRACLTYDQTLRPTVAQLCRDPYVTASNLFD
jgi:tousled-like kinase